MKSQSTLVRLLMILDAQNCRFGMLSSWQMLKRKTFHQLDRGARRSCTVLFKDRLDATHLKTSLVSGRYGALCVSCYCTAQHPVDLSFSLDLAAAPQTIQLQLWQCFGVTQQFWDDMPLKRLSYAVPWARNMAASMKAGAEKVAADVHTAFVPEDLLDPAALTTQCIVTMKSLFGSPILGLRSAPYDIISNQGICL